MNETIKKYTGDTTERELWETKDPNKPAPTVKEGVSRLLSPEQRSFVMTMFQQGKPPLDSEVNLVQQNQNHLRAEFIRAILSSGFLSIDAAAGITDRLSSLRLRNAVCNVNGYLVKLYGANRADTDANSETVESDVIFPEAPYSGMRYDLAFAEFWLEEVKPEESPESNSSAVYRYGGVQSGTLPNDLQDAVAGDETTRRIQLRWRIRTLSDVDFTNYPAGVTHAARVKARGGADGDTAYTYKVSASDAKLYVAGDGSLTACETLRSVDGYVYALPLFKVQRRNQTAYSAQSNPYGAPPFGAANTTPHGLYHDVIDARDVTHLYSAAELAKTLRGQSSADIPSSSGNVALDEAISALGVHQRELEIWQKRRVQQGVVTLRNKYVIAGGVINAAPGTRNLQITRSGTYSDTAASIFYIDGKYIRVKDNKTSVAALPQNPESAAKTYYSYLHYDSAAGDYKVAVADNVPEDALKLYRIVVPAGDSAADLSGCSFADERRVESNYLSCTHYNSAPFALVQLPDHEMLDGEYDVQLTVESASPSAQQAGEVIAYDKAKNGFKVLANGIADNVKARWTVIDRR